VLAALRPNLLFSSMGEAELSKIVSASRRRRRRFPTAERALCGAGRGRMTVSQRPKTAQKGVG
jgi:hypothetical protein